MATYTSTQLGAVKAVHAGSQTIIATHTTTAAGSVSDEVTVRMPRGAKIEDIQVIGAAVGTLLTFNVGDDGSKTRHGTLSLVAASTNKVPTLMAYGHQYLSLSDDKNEWLLKFTTVTATSVSGGWSFTAQVRYHMDA
jgi:hypothetical protein